MGHAGVLIVDDDDSIRGLLAILLSEEVDGPILEAADGETAVRIARESRPAVVMLDLMLPSMDGYGVVGHLRADPRTRHCYVLANSAGGDPARALAAGADEFLPKPFDLDAVVERVQAGLAAVQAGRSPARSAEASALAQPTLPARVGLAPPPMPLPRRRVALAAQRGRRDVPALGAPCPVCGRRVRRLSDHMRVDSPCGGARPARRESAWPGPPSRGVDLARDQGSARDLRATRLG